MQIDPIVDPASLHRCECGAGIFRHVLFPAGATTACMTCGAVRMLAEEYSQPENPHVDAELVATRLLTLDADTTAWVGAFPRVAAGDSDVFLPASLRVSDETQLLTIERESCAGTLPAMLATRLRRAGTPGEPPRRDMRMEVNPFVAVHDALRLTDTSPLDDVLAVASSDTPMAARIAEELLQVPPLLEILLQSLDTRPDPIPRVLARIAPLMTPGRRKSLARTLGPRLARLVSRGVAAEIEIDAIVSVLEALGRDAAAAKPALHALAASDLAARRSVLRASLERIRAAIA